MGTPNQGLGSQPHGHSLVMKGAEDWSSGVLCCVDTKHDDGSWDGDPSGDGSLTHQALLYGSEDEFLAATVPFIQEGLDCNEQIQVTTTDRNAAWLHAALGVAAEQVMFRASSQCYQHPMRTLAAKYRTAHPAHPDEQQRRRLRIIGEPWWTARTAPEAKEWARYESLVNAALAGTNVALMCTYDTTAVEEQVINQVARTHPEVVECGQVRPSPHYADPTVFNSECNASPLAELPAPALWLRFSRTEQLATLRDFVTSQASRVGADSRSVAPFVQAVDEVATNAIKHGGGSGVLQIWTGPQTMLCEVSDNGAGLPDPLVGQLPSPPGQLRGCGLWLARQFSDLLEVHSDPAGTTVRLHLTVS
jgi:anti-sigma regulatory factor (Ser/Thr protein kinase)